MTRTELFDVSSIPGIEDLTRAGQVPANPDALVAARTQLDAAIAAEQPEDRGYPGSPRQEQRPSPAGLDRGDRWNRRPGRRCWDRGGVGRPG